jgi:hypothetical protein
MGSNLKSKRFKRTAYLLKGKLNVLPEHIGLGIMQRVTNSGELNGIQFMQCTFIAIADQQGEILCQSYLLE